MIEILKDNARPEAGEVYVAGQIAQTYGKEVGPTTLTAVACCSRCRPS
jgi:hypothetical protein